MRFTESKKRMPWAVFAIIITLFVLGGVLALGFCGMTPTQKTTQKTIIFKAENV